MIKNILWDFDGVILDSMKIRDWGFSEIFKNFDKNEVEKLISYHNLNGGLSRYVKIRHFYEKILGKEINEERVLEYADKFSVLMKKELINPKNLILESVLFIKENYNKYNFHIVSGSDQNELRFLCRELKIEKYFTTINGSPTPKNKLVKDLLLLYKYDLQKTCLIGDSFNDYEAAKINNISFLAYNNFELNKYNDISPLY
jgi:phosphoglycolate phosphatase-like HAD superfamily hydrolase